MLKDEFERIWEQLTQKRPHVNNRLEQVRIQNIRGIVDVSIRFPYPVSVLAGPNACGKTTVLHALGCLYINKLGRSFTPAKLFPDFKTKNPDIPHDSGGNNQISYLYYSNKVPSEMLWKRNADKWNKSYFGRKGVNQPERIVYLRNLSQLSSPAEIISLQKMGQEQINCDEIPPQLITLAHQILPHHYARLYLLSHKAKDLLFAERDDADHPSYSEFHMSAGERAILRLSRDISTLHDALILIDEIEAGLHPYTQQVLMLELQRLALRQDLQIIVTSHSPFILESVPSEGRIFLERSDNGVTVTPPYRDFVQRALYHQYLDLLSVVCEDDISEELVRGVVEILSPKLDLRQSIIQVGRDTGKDEFNHYIRALAKFNRLDQFIFVLDGDSRDYKDQLEKTAKTERCSLMILVLPGEYSPERYIITTLNQYSSEYAEHFGCSSHDFRKIVSDFIQLYEKSTGKERDIAKEILHSISLEIKTDEGRIARTVGRVETSRIGSDMEIFSRGLEEFILLWRS
ncbi:AAA family ATPase [Methanospirillum hungatei]|jgi:predicted ATPase|uniref:ATP-dependent nuclease n=1 Tax=Methanospirillum hungatei TaxID=2203 RepID=UPI002B96E02D|nr:AAA family ATPase [Methanospirillum hungatei]HOW05253.1 AAA family ATPase [Methanospirillum hungatei]